jgi:hypothetical protein
MLETMPTPVRAARILMFVVAGLTAALTLGSLASLDAGPKSILEVSSYALPGVASFVLAWRIDRRGVALLRWIIGLQSLYILLSLARAASGDPRGLLNLLLPVAVLILITRPPAKTYFASRDRDPELF